MQVLLGELPPGTPERANLRMAELCGPASGRAQPGSHSKTNDARPPLLARLVRAGRASVLRREPLIVRDHSRDPPERGPRRPGAARRQPALPAVRQLPRAGGAERPHVSRRHDRGWERGRSAAPRRQCPLRWRADLLRDLRVPALPPVRQRPPQWRPGDPAELLCARTLPADRAGVLGGAHGLGAVQRLGDLQFRLLSLLRLLADLRPGHAEWRDGRRVDALRRGLLLRVPAALCARRPAGAAERGAGSGAAAGPLRGVRAVARRDGRGPRLPGTVL